MDNKDLLNAATGYVAGNAIAKNIAYNLRKQREKLEKRHAHIIPQEVLSTEIAKFMLNENKDGAFEYLSNCFNTEVIGIAQHQDYYKCSLDTMIQRVKDKYQPFYDRIERPMPQKQSLLTADELCKIVGVKNLHIPDRPEANISSSVPTDTETHGTTFYVIGIIIVIMITILILVYA